MENHNIDKLKYLRELLLKKQELENKIQRLFYEKKYVEGIDLDWEADHNRRNKINGNYVIDIDTQKGNFVLGVLSTVNELLKKDMIEYDSLFYLKNGDYKVQDYHDTKYLCSLAPGRKIDRTHPIKNSIEFLKNGSVLVKSHFFAAVENYLSYTKKEEDIDEIKSWSSHFMEKYYIISTEGIIEEIPYDIGKKMWQNTFSYKNRVELEEKNHIKNMKRKMSKSSISKEEKSRIYFNNFY